MFGTYMLGGERVIDPFTNNYERKTKAIRSTEYAIELAEDGRLFCCRYWQWGSRGCCYTPDYSSSNIWVLSVQQSTYKICCFQTLRTRANGLFRNKKGRNFSLAEPNEKVQK